MNPSEYKTIDFWIVGQGNKEMFGFKGSRGHSSKGIDCFKTSSALGHDSNRYASTSQMLPARKMCDSVDKALKYRKNLCFVLQVSMF